MKLLIEMLEGPEPGEVRVIDGSVPFIIGTVPDALWKIASPGASARLEIRRRGADFVIIADGDVSVESQSISDGSERSIHHGATIEIAGALLRTRIEQDQAGLGHSDIFADASTTTISSILSDVSPGGEAAGGILPGQNADQWLDSLIGGGRAAPTQTPEPSWGASAAQEEPFLLTNPTLPSDWASAPTESANRFEQAGADREGLTVPADQNDTAAQTPDAVQNDALILRQAAGIFEGEISSSDAIQLQNAGQALKALLQEAAEFQRSIDIMLSDLGVAPAAKNLVDHTAFQPGTALGDETGMSIRALSQRLKAMRLEYSAVFAVLTQTMKTARETFDPNHIRVAVSANYGPAARMQATKTGWKEYRQRWSGDDNPLTDAKLTADLEDRLNDLREENYR